MPAKRGARSPNGNEPKRPSTRAYTSTLHETNQIEPHASASQPRPEWKLKLQRLQAATQERRLAAAAALAAATVRERDLAAAARERDLAADMLRRAINRMVNALDTRAGFNPLELAEQLMKNYLGDVERQMDLLNLGSVLQPDVSTQTDTMNTATTSTQTKQTITATNGTQTTVRSYAQAAAQTQDSARNYAQVAVQTEGSGRCYTQAAVQTTEPTSVPTRPAAKTQTNSSSTQKRAMPTQSSPAARALVVHGVRLEEKLGRVRQELEADHFGRVLGIRWLLKEKRREGRTASSVVIYLERPSQAQHVWVGKRRLRAEQYDFDRGQVMM